MWFNPAEITKATNLPIATLATLATLHTKTVTEETRVAEVSKVATVDNLKILPLQNELKTLKDRQREVSRQKAIALMNTSPSTPRGIYVDDEIDPDNVVLFVAVRAAKQTCELTMPRGNYDPFKLLELVEQLGK